MTGRGVCILAILVYALSLGAAMNVRHDSQRHEPVAQRETPEAPEAREAREARGVVGFSINLHHTEKIHLYRQSIDELAALGAGALQIVTPAFQTDGEAETIEIIPGPGRGPTHAQLMELLTYAKQRGLRTALMPVVLFTSPRGNEWRGKISPHDWDAWWESYREAMDYFVGVAVEADVDMLAVGSELLSTERQAERWRDLIAHVRSRYDGKLIYSTNWDHYHVPTWWPQVDFIGISGYWDLTKGAQDDPPSNADLARRLTDVRRSIFAYARAAKMAVVITEVGYPALPWALKDPWNYVAEDGQLADADAQAHGYRAFLDAFGPSLGNEADPLAGVFFYAWDPYHAGGPHDTGYGIRGKPAEHTVRAWLKKTGQVRLNH